MQISISTRHGHLSAGTRENITAKVEKLLRFQEKRNFLHSKNSHRCLTTTTISLRKKRALLMNTRAMRHLVSPHLKKTAMKNAWKKTLLKPSKSGNRAMRQNLSQKNKLLLPLKKNRKIHPHRLREFLSTTSKKAAVFLLPKLLYHL